MYMTKRLSPGDRDFFQELDHVAYGNPFDGSRAELIARLVPAATASERATDREALATVAKASHAGPIVLPHSSSRQGQPISVRSCGSHSAGKRIA